MDSGLTAKIALHVSNKTAFVWSLEDIETLRSTHRICGTLSGTLPQATQQNVFLGLPLVLLPEEVVTLVNENIAIIIDDHASHGSPTAQQLTEWNDNRKKVIGTPGMKNPLQSPPKLSDEALQKRLERQKRKEAQSKPMAESETINEPATPINEQPQSTSAKERSYAFTIPTTSDFPWYSSTCYHTLQEARSAGIWTYPESLKERAKCAVFHDLWKKGYYMGNGLRFGGDWLVYPGDPLRFHSHFVATVFPSPVSVIQPMQIVAYGRLGTATKKVHLLCGWDGDTGETSYYSIEWAGFG
ncbi:tRNA-intron endonuclease catalytic domain-like protein, partial [Serendipita vermifera]